MAAWGLTESFGHETEAEDRATAGNGCVWQTPERCFINGRRIRDRVPQGLKLLAIAAFFGTTEQAAGKPQRYGET